MTKLTATEIMTSDMLVARTEWSVEGLTEFLLSNSISGAPVIDKDGKLVGVVSATDLLRYSSSTRGGVKEKAAPHDFFVHNVEGFSQQDLRDMHIEVEPDATVADIMTDTVFAVSHDTSVQEVAESMIVGRIHRVFVTDEEMKVIGIITTHDLMRLVRDM